MRKCGGYRWEITTFLEKLENSEFIRYGNIKVFENFANVLDIKLVKRRKKFWRIGRWFTVSEVAEEITPNNANTISEVDIRK